MFAAAELYGLYRHLYKITSIFDTEYHTLKFIRRIELAEKCYYSHLSEITKKTGDRLNPIFSFAETWKKQLIR
jgi:hypothetical protein